MCYFKHIFVSKFDVDDNQITFYDKLIRKSMKFEKVQKVFLPLSSIEESHMKITTNQRLGEIQFINGIYLSLN